jgi:hypothetical protein
MKHDSAHFHRPSCKLYTKPPENYNLELKYWLCNECLLRKNQGLTEGCQFHRDLIDDFFPDEELP